MTINTKTEGERFICRLEGRIESSNAGEFEAALELIPAEASVLVLDMEELQFITSAGLRVIMKKLNNPGNLKKIEYINENTEVGNILSMGGFDMLLGHDIPSGR